LRGEVDSAEAMLKQQKAAAKKEAKSDVTRLGKEVKRLEEQLTSWQGKYEEQRVDTKTCEERIVELEKALKDRWAGTCPTQKERAMTGRCISRRFFYCGEQ